MKPKLPQRTIRGAWSCLLLAMAAASAFAQASEPVPFAEAPGGVCREIQASGNPQYPPYLWRDPADENRLVGAIAEMTQWLAKEIGVPVVIKYVGPWGRVQQDARAGSVDLVAGAFFTLPRTEYLDYFHPPFRETRSVLFVAAGSKIVYRRWADLIPLRGVTVIRNSFGEEFDRYAREKLKITEVATLEQAIQLVQRGRADYLVYEDNPALAYMARLGVTDLRALPTPVATENLHLALGYRSACNTPEMRARIQRALYKLAREKQMEGFVQRGLQRWRQQGN
jgi:polar amino acid transport system substrate-binding protein